MNIQTHYDKKNLNESVSKKVLYFSFSFLWSVVQIAYKLQSDIYFILKSDYTTVGNASRLVFSTKNIDNMMLKLKCVHLFSNNSFFQNCKYTFYSYYVKTEFLHLDETILTSGLSWKPLIYIVLWVFKFKAASQISYYCGHLISFGDLRSI